MALTLGGPTPAPAAAPLAGVPAGDPRPRRAAAASRAPLAGPPTVLSVAALLVVVPVCCAAHWRHTASSTWKVSKLLPVPGMTITLGPVGTLAPPLTTSATITAPMTDASACPGIDAEASVRDGVN